jgi:phosphatidylinositol glycan class O
MPPKSTKAAAPAASDPVAKAGDYKSIAAQYAKAKALKDKEDAEKARRDILSGKVPAGAGGPLMTAGDRVKAETGKRKVGEFKKAWSWGMGFWIWLLWVLFLH